MAQNKAFKLGGIGAPCCCVSTCTTEICVTGCTSSLVGLTVTVKSGATIVGTGTTGPVAGCAGGVDITIPAPGSYTVVISGTGLTTNTSTHTLTCGGLITINIGNPPTGAVCCNTCPVPTTLTGTDSNSTFTLTYNSLANVWFGSYTLSGVPTMQTVAASGLPHFCICSANTSGSIPVCYQFSCAGSPIMYTCQRFWYTTTRPAGSGCAPNPRRRDNLI